MSVMHFTELNSTIMVSYCKLVVTLTSLMSPIPNHAKIDVPEAHPSRPGATKARWDPQGTPGDAMGHAGRRWRVYLWFCVFVHISQRVLEERACSLRIPGSPGPFPKGR